MPLDAKQIYRRVSDLSSLPTLPGIISKLSSMAENDNVSSADLAEFASHDQVLSAKVLRLVNSPIYGFPRRISSVRHAVVLLGFNVVKGLVLGTAVFDTFTKHAQGLWEHSLGCAVVGRSLARQMGMADAEEVMIAGLLHDIGKATLGHLAPEDYQEALAMAHEEGCTIGAAEKSLFGINHAKVAEWLGEQWHLPPRLSDPLGYHHRPSRARHSKDVTAVVHVADILARGMGYGHPGDDTMPELDDEAFRLLGLSFPRIDKALEEAETDYVQGAGIFNVDGQDGLLVLRLGL